MARQLDGGVQASRNWGLLLAIVFCVEFWVYVVSAVSENL
jgi:hypothetical protein